ncbi:MAG: right-handed parallel beta-helix repeat-containing protein [Deltaproteobacteria bacterium]|nr:right-handed parallel beta-helix repeat-containing protein [Deltaproteobacteria bacterium]
MPRNATAIVVLCLATGACSSKNSGSEGRGGTSGTGGQSAGGGVTASGGSPAGGGGRTTGFTSAAGGATTATGGSRAAGGIAGAGAIVATGGTRAPGGSAGVGGATGGGGSRGTGGRISTGGSRAAGGTMAAGGVTATGGATAAGGATASGGSGGGLDGGAIEPPADGLIGFAAVPGLGLETTTGGKGGPVVTPATLDELRAAMDSNDAMIILVGGTFDLGGMTPLRSNKTLIGSAGARLVNGGLEIYKRQNIVIRNIVFADGTDDTMKINQNTHHVWVDHCDFTNSADGLFDITRQTSFITISYNRFYQHSKTMLIGHSDSASDDTGYLKTTVHHNWFDGTEQRHPRVRFGEVHVFNNYYLDNGLYGVASTMEADVVMEGNFFEGVAHPSYVGYDESGPGDLVERNNVYRNSGTPETRGAAFDPTSYYRYVVDDPDTIPARVKAQAGAGVLDPDAVLAAAR